MNKNPGMLLWYSTACEEGILGLAEKTYIYYVCTWTLFMRTERLDVKQGENIMAVKFWKIRK